jgi:hypothetical protein
LRHIPAAVSIVRRGSRSEDFGRPASVPDDFKMAACSRPALSAVCRFLVRPQQRSAGGSSVMRRPLPTPRSCALHRRATLLPVNMPITCSPMGRDSMAFQPRPCRAIIFDAASESLAACCRALQVVRTAGQQDAPSAAAAAAAAAQAALPAAAALAELDAPKLGSAGGASDPAASAAAGELRPYVTFRGTVGCPAQLHLCD